ncbi:MAG: PEP-CTERM sorting domain-containing protein [Roseimicrobium sp.]
MTHTYRKWLRGCGIAAAAVMMANSSAHAFTFTVGDSLAGGIAYYGALQMGLNDSGNFSTHTGAWSWEDQSLFGVGEDPVGWTHTSRWIMFTLQEAATVSLTMERDAAVPYIGAGNVGGFADVALMFPSFTLWQGWDNDLMPAPVAVALGYVPAEADDHHAYNNDGNVDWAEDLAYLYHHGNSTQASISDTLNLAAGQYTFVLGSDAPSTTSPPRQGFRLSLSTTPEPGRGFLMMLSGAALLLRRRRR